MDFLVATRNRHKLEEIRAILAIPGVFARSAVEFPNLPDVVENGATFEENAVLKAETLARASGLWTLADDSGLEVDALHGDPGVRSARYAGKQGADTANNRKLLQALEGVRERRARFRCVIAVSAPSGRARVVEGQCEGRIIDQPRGSGGFGYDPLFVPEGYTLTFAELAAPVKNRISHRAAALRRAMEAWGALLASAPRDWP